MNKVRLNPLDLSKWELLHKTRLEVLLVNGKY